MICRLRSTYTVIGLLVALSACGPSIPDEGGVTQQPPLVEAIQARVGALPVEELLPGTVRARNQVVIRPETSGRVVEVLVWSGDAVSRGQELVRLDDTEARERLRQSRADVQLAEAAASAAQARAAELEGRVSRVSTLATEKLVSAQELETLEAQLEVLRASAREAAARVEQARAVTEERRSALLKTVVRSPVSGRLGERRVEVGMLAGTSDALFVVGDLDELIVEVDLTERMLEVVREGQAVVIEARRGSTTVDATLARISPFLDADSFTTSGEIDVANPEGALRPGMFVDVRILVGETERAALVPVSGLWESPEGGERGVFVVEDWAGLEEQTPDSIDSPDETRGVRFRPVTVLAEGRGIAGVDGLEGGEWVVTVGQHMLAAESTSDVGQTEIEAAPQSFASETRARVRTVSWERVLELQGLQNEDLLADFLAKQRVLAEELGAEIPDSEESVNRVLERRSADGSTAGGE